MDLRVVLQNKPGCPARGDDVVWGLVEIECEGEEVNRVAVCGRAVGEPVFRSLVSSVALVMGHDEDKTVTLCNDLAVDISFSVSFVAEGVVTLVPTEQRISALGQLDLRLASSYPGTDTLVATSSLGHTCEVAILVEVRFLFAERRQR